MAAMRWRSGSKPRLEFVRHVAVVLCVTVLSSTYARSQAANTVLFNGKILTVDKDFRVAQALAISHG
jgi:hypothetical protein